MKFGTVWKYYFTESLLKATIRTPSQFNLAPNALRPLLDQLCRLFPQNPTVQIRPLRLAGVRGEEIKAQASATQLIFHIHGGAFFLGSLNTHRALMTDISATKSISTRN